jgi:hypothetical protein
MTTRRLDLDVVGEQGREEDKEDFMVEEMRRPGNAGGVGGGDGGGIAREVGEVVTGKRSTGWG